jgi:nitric oxide reductase subunit B
MLSLAMLLGGIGLLLATFGRWNFLGWHGREEQRIAFRPPDQVMLTPAQRSCAGFFLVMALLFLMQALLGGASEHYRAELTNFFGFDLARVLPFNMARTWHLQLAIFWVATSYLAAGIFLVPMITGREPRGQGMLSYLLLGALAVVVFGSMAGEYAGVFGWGWASLCACASCKSCAASRARLMRLWRRSMRPRPISPSILLCWLEQASLNAEKRGSMSITA